MDRELRHGIWKKRMGSLLFGKRVGIVGFGRIGHRVAEILREMGAIVNYADPFVKDKGVFKRISKIERASEEVGYCKSPSFLFEEKHKANRI